LDSIGRKAAASRARHADRRKFQKWLKYIARDTRNFNWRLAADAPVIHVRGLAYKGAVEITTRPPQRPALRR